MAEPDQPGPHGRKGEPNPEGRMSFLEHLLELRRRLIVSVLAVVLMMVLALVFYEQVIGFLQAPVDRINETFRTSQEYQTLMGEAGLDPAQPVVHRITTGPLDMLSILMRVSLWAGLVLSSPILIYEIWAFVAPGLRAEEKRAVRPVLTAGILFFIAGALFCYYVVFPYTLEFLVWFDVSLHYQPSYTPVEYIGLLVTFMAIFGGVFEIPLVVAILARLGLLKPRWLTVFWRYILVVIFILGSVLSPGTDVVSMLLMSGTMCFLYGLSILLAYMLYPKGKREEGA